jgi:hypothetical protein
LADAIGDRTTCALQRNDLPAILVNPRGENGRSISMIVALPIAAILRYIKRA